MIQKQLRLKQRGLPCSSLKNIYWILGGLPKKGDKIDLTNLKKRILINVT